MTFREIASAVLGCVGGVGNIVANSLCMTRLRITVADPRIVQRGVIDGIEGVLGTATRGANGIEVVFGPSTAPRVYQAFSKLTGLDSTIEPLIGSRRPESNFQVHITPGKRKSFTEQAVALSDADGDMDEYDSPGDTMALEGLVELLGGTIEEPEDAESDELRRYRLLVINGPNLNMLGIREPDLYGSESYPALLELCKEAASEAGFDDCRCYQSNHEGDLVDVIQDAYGSVDAIVINPGAYTHTSVALLDALKAVCIPAIEVHISKVDEREDFRQVSYVRAACLETITGLGIEGYRVAIRHLANHLGI